MQTRGIDTPRMSRSRRRLPLLALAGVLVASLAGCGLLGGDSGEEAKSGGSLETTKLKIGVIPVVDTAPLFLAMQNGYFAKEGLEVVTESMQSGPATVNALVGGDIKIAFTTYPAAVSAQTKKAGNFKFVADGYQARPGHLVLVTPPGSSITKPTDVPGKKIAVVSQNTISDLAPMSVLKTMGVDVSKIVWVPMPFSDMAARMQSHDVDGAVVAEPFVTEVEKSIGAAPLIDAASGPTAEMPMSGWMATDEFANANPKTVAAFQRAMARGIEDAQDRSKLEPVLTKNIKISPETAALVTIATYPKTLEAARLQRVPDLMLEFGVLKERFDIRTMLLPSATTGQ